MTDALIIGDVHLSDKAPSSRKATYTEEILAKLQFCAEFANQNSLPVVQAGDLFHIKAPSKNSHRLVQQVHEIFKQVNNGVWIVPGNHDLQHDRLESLPEQPLGALSRMSNVRLLMGEDSDLDGIAGIPYLTTFDQGNLYWPEQLRYNPFDLDTPELIVTHAPFFPPGQEPGVYEHMSIDLWADVHCGIPATYYGHIHDYHGVFTSSDGEMTFCNQGALSRGSLHESSINRKPAVTWYRDGSFERIEVPHKPADEVFLFEQAAVKAENKASALEFAAALGTTKLASLTKEAVLASVRGQTSKDVLRVIEKVLEDG